MRGASDSKNYFSGIILIAKHLLDDFGVILVSTFISCNTFKKADVVWLIIGKSHFYCVQ